MGRPVGALAALAATVWLSACDLPVSKGTPGAGRPVPRPDTASEALPGPPSAESLALARRYSRLQDQLVARGLLRTDGGGPDTQFSSRQLQENFVRIALYSEFLYSDGRLVARESPTELRRWEGPVRIALSFGSAHPAARRAADLATSSALASRLTRASGLEIALVAPERANMVVYVVSEEERIALGPELARRFPGLSATDLTILQTLDPEMLCVVAAFTAPEAGRPGPEFGLVQAVVIVRAELPDLLRTSCLHEEISQGLGLPNDSSAARPSIFNDDEEFATLTTHDEHLLRILYDRRLRPGMRENEVRALLPGIVATLFPGTS